MASVLFITLGLIFGIFDQQCGNVQYTRTITYKFEPSKIRNITLDISEAEVEFRQLTPDDLKNQTDEDKIHIKAIIRAGNKEVTHEVNTRLLHRGSLMYFTLKNTTGRSCQTSRVLVLLPVGLDLSTLDINVVSEKGSLTIHKPHTKFSSLSYTSEVGVLSLEGVRVEGIMEVNVKIGVIRMTSSTAQNITIRGDSANMVIRSVNSPILSVRGSGNVQIDHSNRCDEMDIDMDHGSLEVILETRLFAGSYTVEGHYVQITGNGQHVSELSLPRYKRGTIGQGDQILSAHVTSGSVLLNIV